MIEFLSRFVPDMSNSFTNISNVCFEEQCQAMLDADPNVISSIMGLFKPSFVRELKERRIKWFATVTSVGEAIIAEEAGADALVVQGSEAGGHRGNFCTDYAPAGFDGTFANGIRCSRYTDHSNGWNC